MYTGIYTDDALLTSYVSVAELMIGSVELPNYIYMYTITYFYHTAVCTVYFTVRSQSTG